MSAQIFIIILNIFCMIVGIFYAYHSWTRNEYDFLAWYYEENPLPIQRWYKKFDDVIPEILLLQTRFGSIFLILANIVAIGLMTFLMVNPLLDSFWQFITKMYHPAL